MRSNIENSLLCFLDFETTGLTPGPHCAIEVACVWTQGLDLIEVVRFESLIEPKPGLVLLCCGRHVWREGAQRAYQVHKIHAQDVINAAHVLDVTTRWTKIDSEAKLQAGKSARTILVSDNAQFEHGFATELYERAQSPFPFHYSTWDTNLLLAVAELQKPHKAHRASSDIEGLLETVREALINCWGTNGTW